MDLDVGRAWARAGNRLGHGAGWACTWAGPVHGLGLHMGWVRALARPWRGVAPCKMLGIKKKMRKGICVRCEAHGKIAFPGCWKKCVKNRMKINDENKPLSMKVNDELKTCNNDKYLNFSDSKFKHYETCEN